MLAFRALPVPAAQIRRQAMFEKSSPHHQRQKGPDVAVGDRRMKSDDQKNHGRTQVVNVTEPRHRDCPCACVWRALEGGWKGCGTRESSDFSNLGQKTTSEPTIIRSELDYGVGCLYLMTSGPSFTIGCEWMSTQVELRLGAILSQNWTKKS